jgi:hypothetical protein
MTATDPSNNNVPPTGTSASGTAPATATATSASSSDNYFDQNTLLLMLGFLAVYFIIHTFLGFFYNKDDPNYHSLKSRMVDIIVFGLIIGTSFLYYFSLTQKEKEDYLPNLLVAAKAYFNNAYSIVEIVLFILFFYIGVYILGIPMTPEDKPAVIAFFESNAYILLGILLIIQFFKYFLNVQILDVIFGGFNLATLFPGAQEQPTNASLLATPLQKSEVFNISNNLYSYNDAQSVCSALGSRLATYDEIEESYNNGAEWSTYGWSEGQHAYFPTQKNTWNKLQQIKGHEHDLGRPGVNGGYFSNPNVRFGVNCYGVKPPMTDAEKARMDAKRNRIYPKTAEDALVDTKVEFWKKHKDKLMVVSGFNNDAWSRY